MAPVSWKLFFALFFLYFIPLMLAQIGVYHMCPELNQTNTTTGAKKQVRIGVVFDWNTSIPADESTSIDTLYELGRSQFSSSSLAQEIISYSLMINSDSKILPEHALCLWIVFYRCTAQGIQNDLPLLLDRNEIRAVASLIMEDRSFQKQNSILRSYFPLLNLKPRSVDSCLSVSDFEELRSNDNHCYTLSYFPVLEIVPVINHLLIATRSFTSFMGWEKIGFITDCMNIPAQNGTVYFSKYNPRNFVQMFEPFAKNEIRIYIFLGNPRNYLHLIQTAYKMGVTRKG